MYSAVAGGFDNSISDSYATISGGNNNSIQSGSTYSAMGGGSGNQVYGGSAYSAIAGGGGNNIYANNSASAIAGGSGNSIQANTPIRLSAGATSTISPMARPFRPSAGAKATSSAMAAAGNWRRLQQRYCRRWRHTPGRDHSGRPAIWLPTWPLPPAPTPRRVIKTISSGRMAPVSPSLPATTTNSPLAPSAGSDLSLALTAVANQRLEPTCRQAA